MELRKREPHMTKEMAFSKIYCDSENRHLRAAERLAHGFHEYAPVEKAVPVATLDPVVERDMAMGELKKLAEEIRRDHPFKTPSQLGAQRQPCVLTL